VLPKTIASEIFLLPAFSFFKAYEQEREIEKRIKREDIEEKRGNVFHLGLSLT